MAPVLRLFEDVLANDGAELSLPARPHMIYVVHGSILIADKHHPVAVILDLVNPVGSGGDFAGFGRE